MSKVLVTENNLQDIANAIRSKNEGTDVYRPGDMAAAILAIPTGGGSTLVSKTITQNGEYDPEDDNADGYSDVTVNVPNSYTAADEGKVVSNGALVAQTTHAEVTQNGTIDTTLNNSVTVNVSSGGGTSTGTTAPDPSHGSNGDLYIRTFPLPSNINFVEYLQSSGTQYVDTGILIGADTDVSLSGISRNVVAWVAGTRNASTITSATVALAVSFSGSTTTYCTKAFGSSHDILSCLASSGSLYHHRTKTQEINGVKIVTELSASGTSNGYRADKITTATAQYSVVLFGVNTSGSITKSNNVAICRATFFESGVPIADYLPCLDENGVACMWDNVAGEYVYNNGTGDFSYGNAVIPDSLPSILYQKQNGAWVYLSDVDDAGV